MCGQGAQARPHRALGLGEAAAGRALGEVRLARRRGVSRQLAVDERRHLLGIAAGRLAHFALPASARRSAARPRWMRDITVPAGTPRMPAISS